MDHVRDCMTDADLCAPTITLRIPAWLDSPRLYQPVALRRRIANAWVRQGVRFLPHPALVGVAPPYHFKQGPESIAVDWFADDESSVISVDVWDVGDVRDIRVSKRQCYEKALLFDPLCVAAWVNLGFGLTYGNETEEGFQLFHRAVEVVVPLNLLQVKGASLSSNGSEMKDSATTIEDFPPWLTEYGNIVLSAATSPHESVDTNQLEPQLSAAEMDPGDAPLASTDSFLPRAVVDCPAAVSRSTPSEMSSTSMTQISHLKTCIKSREKCYKFVLEVWKRSTRGLQVNFDESDDESFETAFDNGNDLVDDRAQRFLRAYYGAAWIGLGDCLRVKRDSFRPGDTIKIDGQVYDRVRLTSVGLRFAPTMSNGWYRLALYKIDAGESAVEESIRAITLRPLHEEAWNLLGLSLVMNVQPSVRLPRRILDHLPPQLSVDARGTTEVECLEVPFALVFRIAFFCNPASNSVLLNLSRYTELRNVSLLPPRITNPDDNSVNPSWRKRQADLSPAVQLIQAKVDRLSEYRVPETGIWRLSDWEAFRSPDRSAAVVRLPYTRLQLLKRQVQVLRAIPEGASIHSRSYMGDREFPIIEAGGSQLAALCSTSHPKHVANY